MFWRKSNACLLFCFPQELHAAMRRAGQNPTESEVQDMINSVRFSQLQLMYNQSYLDHSKPKSYELYGENIWFLVFPFSVGIMFRNVCLKTWNIKYSVNCNHMSNIIWNKYWRTRISSGGRLFIEIPTFCKQFQVDVDGSGFVEFPEFCNLMYKKISDADTENELKETFRVFSKDNEGEDIIQKCA